jgi:hypothetical protein
VSDIVLRPLSAKLLNVTIPESQGIIKREMLYSFSGRSRKPQMAIAQEFGLSDYPSPAGGCLLTEPNYACRLKDLLKYSPSMNIRDIDLLRVGRHFRFYPNCKIIVGRDKTENAMIESLSTNLDCLLKVEGYGSPLVLVTGEISDKAINVAASLCAKYSDAKNLPEVEVNVFSGSGIYKLKAIPASYETIEELRIERGKAGKVMKASRVSP